MSDTRLRAVAIATLLSLALLIPGRPAGAAVATYDAANLVQNVLQVLKEIETIRRLVAQLRAMYVNLQRVGEPSWRDLRSYVVRLNQLAQQGRALAYSLEGIFGRYRAVMAGFTPMQPGLYEATYGDWTEITLDTLAATLDTARAQAETYASTQEQIGELRILADAYSGLIRSPIPAGSRSPFRSNAVRIPV